MARIVGGFGPCVRPKAARPRWFARGTSVPPRLKTTASSLKCRRGVAAFAGAAADRGALRGRSGSPRGGLRALGGRIPAAGRSRDAHSRLARRRAHFSAQFRAHFA